MHHPFITAEVVRVFGRTSEDLGPPRGDIAPMLIVHATRKERREQVVLLDSVIEGIDHPVESFAAARPFKSVGFSPIGAIYPCLWLCESGHRLPPYAAKRIMPVRLDRISSRTGLVA